MATILVCVHARIVLDGHLTADSTVEGPETIKLRFRQGRCMDDILTNAQPDKAMLFTGSLRISLQGNDQRVGLSHVPKNGEAYDIHRLTAPRM